MDLNKSREFFDPDNVKTSCQIIGCGAIGSTVAENLTRLGIKELTLWDSDIVASHNIANQMFRFNDIGSLKINALDDMLHDINPDIKINLRPEFVTKQPMSGFIFLCVDDIEVRKQIAENLRPNPYIKAMFDFRMRLLDAQHYATPWDNEKEKEIFINSMQFSHDEAIAETPVSACGFELSVVPTVRSIVAVGIANFINYTLQKPLQRMILVNSFTFDTLYFPTI